MQVSNFSTASTILTQARAECGIGANPTSTALQNTAMLRALNDINEEGVNYPYSVGILGWKFMEAEMIISTIANTNLNGAISSGAISLILTSSTGWYDPASADIAAGYIKTSKGTYDFFSYTELTSSTLSGVDGIQMAHADAEECHKIYQLNTNFGKIRAVHLEGFTEYYFWDDNKRQIPYPQHFTLKALTNGDYKRSFIVFPEDIGSREFKIDYIKKPTTISATTDTVDLPDGHGRRFLVERLKAYIWTVLGELTDAQAANQSAQMAIRELSHFSVQHVTPSQSLKFSW